MYKFLILFVFLGCQKKNDCGLHTFSAVSCEQDEKGPRWEVQEQHPIYYILSPEECEFHRKNLIKLTSGTHFVDGKEVNVENLIYCECQ